MDEVTHFGAGQVAGRHRRVKVWDWPLRLFHWTLVIAIAVAFLSSEEGSPLNRWHMIAGWIAGILVLFRIVWGFVGGEHSRFADFVRPGKIGEHVSGLLKRRSEPSLGHNPLGGLSVLVLLTLTAVTVWTGGFGGETAEDLHELIAWVLLAAVALHVLAVIAMSLLDRENLVRAMVTGDKPAERHEGAENARPPGTVAWLIAAVVLVGAVYAILRYDPQAFTPRTPESVTHQSASAEAEGD